MRLQAQLLQLVGLPGVGLVGHKQPDIGFGDTRFNALVCFLLLYFDLVALERIQVERFTFNLALDRIPRQELTHPLLEILQAVAVSGQEDQRIAIPAVGVPPQVEHLFGGCPGLAVLIV